VNADTNEDGIISFYEAFVYAKGHDAADETPQYVDYPVNIGENLSLWVTNLPPENPMTPNGTAIGIAGREYTFSTNASDPENEDVYYQFDWGDGNLSDWIGSYPSGATGSGSHAWYTGGVYFVRAKAMDIKGGESDWSEPHEITIYELPTLEVQRISAKVGRLNVTVKNTGTVNVTDLNWSISLTGGIIPIGKKTTGGNEAVDVGMRTYLFSDFIFGFGKPATITVRLETQGQVFEQNATATVLAFFILYIKLV
jgi:hypothetical protein